MTVNVDKLAKNLNFITENANRWKQETWAESDTIEGDTPPKAGECGTAFCLAGWAVVNEGIQLQWEKNYMGTNSETGKPLYQWYAHYTKDGKFISEEAMRILGLADDELFRGGNSLARLWTLGEEVSNGKIQRPENAPTGRGYGGDEDEGYDEDDCDCDSCRW